MTPPRPPGRPRGVGPMTAEARQVKLKTWSALLVVTVVVAGAVLVDGDASPVLSGVLVLVPLLELMIFGVWYRRSGGVRPR